ncbi:MAG: pseudouridine synthase [Hylemonella sp.]|uniref:pseudouridine synthase n=1 Tax=Hylemonella sp. TaxID=2066020 RepID=UPI0022BE75AC|nr:pseudouridine synthase [Hylemonella sp.]MCZ8251625.1 pseudouridine synthase [Hylemonella sp.]
MIDGVSASCVALPHGPWPRLIDFLTERLPAVSAAQWAQRMSAGRVLDEDGATLAPEAVYAPGQRVYYYRELDAEPVIPFEETIVHQDEHLLVADKPHFLPVTPTGRYVQQTLLVRLKRRTGIETLTPIHRIDRETAGLVVFSVRPQDRDAYQRLFRQQQVEKVYEAIAPLRPERPLPAVHRSRIVEDEQFFRQREVPGEPNSETALELVEARGTLALYRLRPKSGRTHQLRVHMNALGRPIVGDLFYPVVVHGPGHAQDDLSQPLRLLARALAFNDPVSGHPRTFESRRRLDWPAQP